jgi:hypothetical protein
VKIGPHENFPLYDISIYAYVDDEIMDYAPFREREVFLFQMSLIREVPLSITCIAKLMQI